MRSPIAAVRGHLEVVRRRERSRAEYRQAIDIALDEVGRLQALAEDLLTLARRDADALVVRHQPLELDRLLGEVAFSYRALAEDRGITLAVEPSRGGSVIGDADLIRRLVRNLLDNAIRYTQSGGKVWLRAGREDGQAWLEVTDNGPGIPPAYLPHLFERFRRRDVARDGSSGTGLGLAIAQAIAEAHGGRLTAGNRAEGGAVFRFAFPSASDTSAVA